MATPAGRREISHINDLTAKCPTGRPYVCQGVTSGSSKSDDPANENPGALAGATGAERHWSNAWLDHTLKRIDAASGLRAAVLAIPAADRLPFLEAALVAVEPDWPGVPFIGPLTEARDWAAWASLPQREALTLACFETLPAHRQAAFLAHVAPQRRAAA